MNEKELEKRITMLESMVAQMAVDSGFDAIAMPALADMVARGETAAAPLLAALTGMLNSSQPPDA